MRNRNFNTLAMIVCILFSSASARGDSLPVLQEAGNGSIIGTVTLDGAPATGIRVRVSIAKPGSSAKIVAESRTNGRGEFSFSGLTPGQYFVSALSPGFVSDAEAVWSGVQGRMVNVDGGKSAQSVAVRLVRGAVITGRVTVRNGRPVIGERVHVIPAGGESEAQPLLLPNPESQLTDDRGIYRLFGIPPGKYLVAVGRDVAVLPDLTQLPAWYEQTYAPGVKMRAEAKTVDVSTGDVAGNVDIAIDRATKGRRISGIVRDASNGAPVPNIMVRYTVPNAVHIPSYATEARADESGRFTFPGAMPGRYVALAVPDDASELYGVVVPFEVGSADFSGLELPVRQSGTISGVVLVEGTTDPTITSGVQKITIVSYVRATGTGGASTPPADVRVAPDGTFRLMVPSGLVRIGFNPETSPAGYNMLRIEGDSVTREMSIPVEDGEHIQNVRLIFAYGRARLSGRVTVNGGELPPNVIAVVLARLVSPVAQQKVCPVDGRGAYVIGDLPGGEYRVTVRFASRAPGQAPPAIDPISEMVHVDEDGEARLDFVVDLATP